jgi:formate dehydrogenase major subunit
MSESNSRVAGDKTLGICPYCGCGCRLSCKSDSEGNIERVMADKEDVVSRGRPCVKGVTVHEMLSTNRITSPMIRKDKRAELEECSWTEAFEFIKQRLTSIYEEKAGQPLKDIDEFRKIRDEVYFAGSGESTNEANYLFSKLCRSVFGSNNIDSCARLCHAATAVGFNKIFGMKAIPEYTVEDLKEGDAFLFVGTDPMEDYPVLFNRVLQAKKNGAKIITVDVSANSTTMQSDKFVRIAPQGIIPLIAHICVKLVEDKDISRDARKFHGFNAFMKSVETIAEQNPLSTIGISREDFAYLYETLDEAKNPVIGFGMGLTQHNNGVQNVLAISGLSLLLDAILFPNRGKVNVQGAGDMGAEPGWEIPTAVLDEFNWNDDFCTHDGEVITKALYGETVNFFWVIGSNPSHSMPHLNLLDEQFEKTFVVFQHHHKARTMEFADVVLPSKVIFESQGSTTNGERRVRGFYAGINRKSTIGGTAGSDENGPKSDFEIIRDFAQYIGSEGFAFDSEKDVFEEIVKVVPDYKGLELKKVATNEGQFAHKKPLMKKFVPIKYKREHFKGEGDYPYTFTTARSKYHFCTGEGTRSSKTLMNMESEPYVRISTYDAQLLSLRDKDHIAITSSVGTIEASIKIDSSLDKRVLVAPYHFEKLLVNKLAPLNLDPVSGTPCYKQIAVNIKRL